MVYLLSIIVVFVVLSGLAALVDAAFLSVTSAEVQAMVTKKLPGAFLLQKLKNQSLHAVVVIVVYTNAVNVVGPIMVGTIATTVFSNTTLGVLTAIITLATIIFSEILPKTFGTAYAPTVSRYSAAFLYVSTKVLFPVIWPLEKFITLFGAKKRLVGTEEQIRSLVQLGKNAGHIETDESNLIRSAFELNDTTAEQVAVKSENIIWLEPHMNTFQAAKVIFEHPFSRYPLRDNSGLYVLSREILQNVAEGNLSTNVRNIAHKALQIEPSFLLDELLIQLRNENTHLALIKSNNQVTGLITLEDVLEQLVGQIEDELGKK